MRPKETIEGFDAFLAMRGLSLEAVIIGGAALSKSGRSSTPAELTFSGQKIADNSTKRGFTKKLNSAAWALCSAIRGDRSLPS